MRNGVIGSTADSDSVSRGSSPFSVAGNLQRASSLFYRSVAQLGRALRSGRRGRRFESCHSDFFIAIPQSLELRALRFFFYFSILLLFYGNHHLFEVVLTPVLTLPPAKLNYGVSGLL